MVVLLVGIGVQNFDSAATANSHENRQIKIDLEAAIHGDRDAQQFNHSDLVSNNNARTHLVLKKWYIGSEFLGTSPGRRARVYD